MDELFDNSPFNKLDEPEESDPPASISVEQDVSFEFPSKDDARPASNGARDEHEIVEDSEEEVVANKPTTPRDDIKVFVKSYQTTEDDFTFSVEVSG